MKPIQRVKVEKTLKKIESGEFDENDIDSIFMALRPYSYGNILFREIADFVAHNDNRNKGLTKNSLESFHFSLKFFIEYVYQKQPFNIKGPFPIYIKKLMSYQVDKCEETILKEKFNITKQKLKSKIDNIFSEDKKNKTASMKKNQISINILDAISYTLSFISPHSPFYEQNVVSELINVARANNLEIDATKILKYSDKIEICTMLLLHDATFEYDNHTPGYCKISCENRYVLQDETFVDAEYKKSFGNLQVSGHIVVDVDGKNTDMCYTLMQTNVPVEKWCDDDMFVTELITENGHDFLRKKILLDSSLHLNSNGKIGVINI